MPVSSLPSKYGIGSFGKSAHDYIDFLDATGQKCWQVLPLNPTSYGDSPYQSPSTVEGNWSWRISPRYNTPSLREKMRSMAVKTKRNK